MEAYALAAFTNPLNPDAFPGIREETIVFVGEFLCSCCLLKRSLLKSFIVLMINLALGNLSHLNLFDQWQHHPSNYDSCRKMEAEVVRMTIDLFNGDDEACGSVRTCKFQNSIHLEKLVHQ